MPYKKINDLLGWLCFAVAAVTYILTLEPSVSFWDCGEFISCAYRLQVSHQPGYPLFAMLGKVFSLLSMGDNTKIPYYTNLGSAIASAATVMFLFWTITAFAKKLMQNSDIKEERTRLVLIMGSGLVGALAFTFSDTFWFSAVETIVFALSALCTSIVFWAILKWEAHADEPGADKWLIFIAYVIGLSIGIHLLNLLSIPAISLVYYFRRNKNVTVKKGWLAFLVSIVILGSVQFGIREFTIKLAAYFDLFFVNNLGMGFGSGAAVFFLLLIAVLIGGVVYSIRAKKPTLNLAFLCVVFIYFGYSSFVYIPIRATANTNLNNSHPDNAFTLNGYLNRIQYGETPLLTGPYFDSEIIDQKEGATLYRKGEKKYEVTGKKSSYVYDRTTLFPRVYSSEGQDPLFYRQWLQMGDTEKPNMIHNLSFFFSWQVYQMYMRYFMWNFAGRVNEMDGQQQMGGFKGYVDGDWTTGIFDKMRDLPKSVTNDTNYMPLFGLPLFIGLIGMWYHFKRNKRDGLVIALLWFFTGIAIVLYVNQPSVQPRERDYSYVSSFYAFAIWVGLGVIAIAEFLRKKLNAHNAAVAATVLCLLAAPLLMACQEWKGHDRSTKMTAHDMAYNYLISCPKNAILFTFGDNDTYSLWYVQEVEGVRPDVRLVNLSLFTGDWYIHQMQKKMNESAPLPITMPLDKYKDGVRDVIAYQDAKIPGDVEIKEVFDFITSDNPDTKIEYQSGDINNYLPTKNFKLTVNKADVIKNNVVSAAQQSLIVDTMKFKFPSRHMFKDKLAFYDILSHNNWQRPICFTATAGSENMMGLQNYMYKEGFITLLIPLKPDTTVHDQSEKVNALVMYDIVMNKFKFGNYKTAKYLDHESRVLFYPVMTSTFVDLANGLIKEGRRDLALNVLHKFDKEMPYLYVDIASNGPKFYLARLAYELGDIKMGTKIATGMDEYLDERLTYMAKQLHGNAYTLNGREIEMGVQMINGLAKMATDNHQTQLAAKFDAHLKKHATAFAAVLQQMQ